VHRGRKNKDTVRYGLFEGTESPCGLLVVGRPRVLCGSTSGGRSVMEMQAEAVLLYGFRGGELWEEMQLFLVTGSCRSSILVS
jgi:hypothetical protein